MSRETTERGLIAVPLWRVHPASTDLIAAQHAYLTLSSVYLADRGHSSRDRDDRHRPSRYDERDYDRYSRRDDRDRRDRGDRGREREQPARPDDYNRRGSRYEDDRRRDYRGDRGGRGGREDDFGQRPRRGRDEDRGGFGGRGRDRGRGGGANREGGDTDAPEKRSPTPEGAVPLSQRKRKASGWDVAAPGYEQYTAVQAKQTGKLQYFHLLVCH